MVAGGLSGALGALACNPLEIVKTRMQSSAAKSLALGHQHGYTGIGNAFGSIVKNEGFRVLYKGSAISMLRSTSATAVNLTTYTLLKERFVKSGLIPDGVIADISCGFTSALLTAAAINPIEVLRTRLYNQPFDKNGQGVHYSSGVDVLKKTVKGEGLLALYKGFVPSFLRLGPHFVLTFVFLEQLHRADEAYINRRDELLEAQALFAKFDLDHSGLIDRKEIMSIVRQSHPRLASHDVLSEDSYERSMEEEAQKIVTMLDKNGDGQIDLEEFRSFLSEMKKVYRLAELSALFEKIDADGNGRIDLGELLAAYNQSIATKDVVNRCFKLTPQMSPSDMDLMEQNVKKMMQFADKDGSGSIDFEEFQSICNSLQVVQAGKVFSSWMRSAGVGM